MHNKQALSRLRVGVLMGGMSSEHEVSFNSGRTVCDHLDTSLYEVTALYQARCGKLYLLPRTFLHRGKTSDFIERLEREAKALCWDDLASHVDFIFHTLHGRGAEDGTLQGLLEVLGIPYLGSGVFASALTLNKRYFEMTLASNGIDVPRSFFVDEEKVARLEQGDFESVELLKKELRDRGIAYPCVVKPVSEGSSIGVSVVFEEKDLLAAILGAALVDVHNRQGVLVQEKLEGMEFVFTGIEGDSLLHGDAVSKFGGWVGLPLTHIVHKEGTHFFDYEQKYMPGVCSKITPAGLPLEKRLEIETLCLKVVTILQGRGLFRVDGFFTHDGRIVIIDAQPIPNMAPSAFIFHQAALLGMSHSKFINYLIETELSKQGMGMNLNCDGQGAGLLGKKKKVAVLFGGDSNEREISLESGRNVCYKLSPHTYEVTPIFVNDAMKLFALSQELLVQNTTRDIARLVKDEGQILWADLAEKFDFVFLGLHGGKGENGVVQGALEMLGVPYNGSGVLASSLCMDKFKTSEFLRMNGFDVLQSHMVYKSQWACENTRKSLASKIETLGYPCIVKPHDDGCSNFVYKVASFEQLNERLDEIFSKGKEAVMVEEFAKGVELTCGVVGNASPKALVPSQPVVSGAILSMAEKFLPGAGENQTPARIPAQAAALVRSTLEKAYKVIGCSGYARIDCFYQSEMVSPTGKERVVILEFNTLPALTPATCIFHQAAEEGVSPMEFLDTIVALGFEKHAGMAKRLHDVGKALAV